MRLLRALRRRRSLPELASQAAYAKWAASYQPHDHNALMEKESRLMWQSLGRSLQGAVVLDLACGTGRYGRHAQREGAARVVGLDNSIDMLRAGVLAQVAQADVTRLPLPPAAFDVIFCGLALGHVPRDNFSRALSEIARVLKPDGIALISDFHPYQALNGAQRTFHGDDGRTYAVEHHVHMLADYVETGRSVGLTLTHLHEPLLHGASGAPVVAVMRFKKGAITEEDRFRGIVDYD